MSSLKKRRYSGVAPSPFVFFVFSTGREATVVRRQCLAITRDNDPTTDNISHDPNNIVLYRANDRFADYASGFASHYHEEESLTRRAIFFDPRSWRFGRTYVVPELTSTRYLCLGENRKSLFSRLVAHYKWSILYNQVSATANTNNRTVTAIPRGGEYGPLLISLDDALRAIHSPTRLITQNLSIPQELNRILIREPFALLNVVHPDDMRRSEFAHELARVVSLDASIIRQYCITYGDWLAYNRSSRKKDFVLPDWRRLDISNYVELAKSANDNNCDSDEDGGDNENDIIEYNKYRHPHILLADSIEPLTEWLPTLQQSPQISPTELLQLSSSHQHQEDWWWTKSQRYANDTSSSSIDVDAHFSSALFFSKTKSLRVWLSVSAADFYERLLPVLLCRLQHLSIYDRCCESTYNSSLRNRHIDRYSEKPRRCGVGRDCVCRQLCDHRIELTFSLLRILLNRLTFDMRYTETKILARYMSRDRAASLFERLMVNGFMCAALPFSYFIDMTTISRLCFVRDQVIALSSFPEYITNGCSCMQINACALMHMNMIRRASYPEDFISSLKESSFFAFFDHVMKIRDGVFETHHPVVYHIDNDEQPNGTTVVSSLTSCALRTALLSRGISETLHLLTRYNLPYNQVLGRTEAYFRETMRTFLNFPIWPSAEQFRQQFNNTFYNSSPWWWRQLPFVWRPHSKAPIYLFPRFYEFPILHNYDSFAYDTALRYVRDGQLDVSDVSRFVTPYEDRRNFALLSALSPETVKIYHRDHLEYPCCRDKMHSPLGKITTEYITRTSSRLERLMLQLWKEEERNDDRDKSSAAVSNDDDNDEFVSGGSVVPDDTRLDILADDVRHRGRTVTSSV